MTDARTLSNGFYHGSPCKHCGGTLRFKANGHCVDKECRKSRIIPKAATPERKAKAAQSTKAREARRKEALDVLRKNLDSQVCRQVFILLSPRESEMLGITL